MSEDCAGRHQCEPGYYPASMEDRWTCPECGRAHQPFRVEDALHLTDSMRRHVKPGQLGWRSPASDDFDGPEPAPGLERMVRERRQHGGSMTADRWSEAVGHTPRVRLFDATTQRGIHAEGRLLAHSIVPMVLIETDSGERIWWRHDLAEVVTRDSTYADPEFRRPEWKP